MAKVSSATPLPTALYGAFLTLAKIVVRFGIPPRTPGSQAMRRLSRMMPELSGGKTAHEGGATIVRIKATVNFFMAPPPNRVGRFCLSRSDKFHPRLNSIEFPPSPNCPTLQRDLDTPREYWARFSSKLHIGSLRSG